MVLNEWRAADIEKIAEKISLFFPQERVEEIEKASLPPFMDSFMEQARSGEVPSQFMLWMEYRYLPGVKRYIDGGVLEQGLKARLYRAYPSLVRDLHFIPLFAEGGFDIRYDRNMDIEQGVDAVVHNEGLKWCLHCFVYTPAAVEYRAAKTLRHAEDKDPTHRHLNMPLHLDDGHATKRGDFYFYSPWHFGRLRRFMNEATEK